jgi:hypothetical protein
MIVVENYTTETASTTAAMMMATTMNHDCSDIFQMVF